jgi:DNA-binding Xre family transcriptional regulator
MIVYREIFERLKKAGYSTYRSKTDPKIGQATLQRIREGKPVSLKTIDIICQIAKCRIEDIVEIRQDK